MIRNLQRSRSIGYNYDYYNKRYKNQVFIAKPKSTKPKIIPLRIGKSDDRFKLKCKLCDFYTNIPFLYERHLSSNNHHIRMNQF